jgi:hypothetical protein
MRPKHALWLTVAAVSLFWYLLDPDARRPNAGSGMGTSPRGALESLTKPPMEGAAAVPLSRARHSGARPFSGRDLRAL